MKGRDCNFADQGKGKGLRNNSINSSISEETFKAGAGPDGYCLCPSCNTRIPHTKGNPCSSVKCPDCGSPMFRGQTD